MLRCNVGGMTVMAVVALVTVGVKGAFDEQVWGFQSYLNVSYTLVCNHKNLQVEPHNHIEWELPNRHMLTKTSKKHVLSDGMRGTATNMRLTILDVTESDAGVYLCYVYTNNRKEEKRGQLLRGLNLGGHKYREPFDEYRDNLMVGGLAALVLFVPLVTVCLVYKFRYQTKEDRAVKHAARLEATKHQRHLQTMGKEATNMSEVCVTGGKGETNLAYDNGQDIIGTRL